MLIERFVAWRVRRRCVGLVCRTTLALMWLVFGQNAGADEGGEAALKAAYLYNFALYTEWPELPPAFQFCIAGKDDFGDALDAIARKQITGRSIHVRRLGEGETAAECTLLFVPAQEKAHLGRLLAPLATRPVLTITDIGIGLEGGAMLHLSSEQGHLSFGVNQTVARIAGLNFSAKMLRLARRVQ
jgi:hypothetical protein